jgi:hypothetical protein
MHHFRSCMGISQMSMSGLILFSHSFSLFFSCHLLLFLLDRWTNATPLPPPMAPNRPRAIPLVDRRTNWPAHGHVTSSRLRVTWSSCQRILFMFLLSEVYVCPSVISVNSFSLYTFVNLFLFSLAGNITSWLWFCGAQATIAECYSRLVSMAPQSGAV